MTSIVNHRMRSKSLLDQRPLRTTPLLTCVAKSILLAAITLLVFDCAPSGQLELDQHGNNQRTSEQSIADSATALHQSPSDLVLGNPDAHTTVVEFFDYNCSFCRRAQPEVTKLLSSDADVRVVIKELPVMGSGSLFAAKAALASARQEKYAQFHDALNRSNVPKNETTVLKVADEIGIDIGKLKEDMQDPAIAEVLSSNRVLAKSLSVSGTPSFIIGDVVLPGFASYKKLREHVASARGK